MTDAQFIDYLRGACSIPLTELLMSIGADTRIVAGQHDVDAAHVIQILMLQLVRDKAEFRAQRPDIPSVLPKKANIAPFPANGMDVTRQQFEQRGFPRAVRPENGRMASETDFEREIAEDLGVATIDGGVLDLDNLRGVRCHRTEPTRLRRQSVSSWSVSVQRRRRTEGTFIRDRTLKI